MKFVKPFYIYCTKHKYKIHLVISVILLIISIIEAVDLFQQDNQLAKQTSIVIIIIGVFVYFGIIIYRLVRASKP